MCRFEYHSLVLPAVDKDLQRFREPYMPDVVTLINYIHTVKKINIIEAFLYKGIYRKIAYPE